MGSVIDGTAKSGYQLVNTSGPPISYRWTEETELLHLTVVAVLWHSSNMVVNTLVMWRLVSANLVMCCRSMQKIDSAGVI